MERKQPIFLVGPTGAGKTACALALAEAEPVEIISIDSALVYRGMDIGSAKPSAAERAAVPHHLIDILDPLESYSAAQFVADAKRLVAEIQARGRRPLLVGGTMLYVKALREGLSELPPSDAAVRAQLDAEGLERGWPALHAELAQVDPITAARLKPNDSQRIQRALEVFRCTGRPLSDWHAHAARSEGVDWPLISIETEDRAWLHQRLDARFDAMLAAGFLDEVRHLRVRGDLHAALRRLPPGLGSTGRGRSPRPAQPARTRPGRHAPAGQAPDHLAAQHAGAADRRCPGAGRERPGARLDGLKRQTQKALADSVRCS